MAFALRLKVVGAEPLLRGRDHMWSVIRRCETTFTVSQVHGQCSQVSRGAVWSFIARLETLGFVESAGDEGKRGAKLYRLIKAPADLPPLGDHAIGRRGQMQKQMWATMRAPICRTGFTPRDIAAYASTATTAISLKTAQQYVRHLDAAGYLAAAGEDEAGAKRYRLKPSMNSGPKPPAILSATVMFDRNRFVVVGETIAEEVVS